jgi:hypothetical protein
MNSAIVPRHTDRTHPRSGGADTSDSPSFVSMTAAAAVAAVCSPYRPTHPDRSQSKGGTARAVRLSPLAETRDSTTYLLLRSALRSAQRCPCPSREAPAGRDEPVLDILCCVACCQGTGSGTYAQYNSAVSGGRVNANECRWGKSCQNWKNVRIRTGTCHHRNYFESYNGTLY